MLKLLFSDFRVANVKLINENIPYMLNVREPLEIDTTPSICENLL